VIIIVTTITTTIIMITVITTLQSCTPLLQSVRQTEGGGWLTEELIKRADEGYFFKTGDHTRVKIWAQAVARRDR
jgi:hypothetical protein